VHDVAEPDEFEKLGQATVRPVEQEPTSAPGHGDLQSCQRIHGGAIGWHQPRDIEIDGFVTGGRRRRCRRAGPGGTISQALVHVIRHSQRSLPVCEPKPCRKNSTRGQKSSHWPRRSGEISQAAFIDGFQIGCLVAAGVLFAGVAFATRFLAALPTPTTAPEPEPERAPALETASAAVGAGVLDWVPCLTGFSG
jgi:hypothetical protein